MATTPIASALSRSLSLLLTFRGRDTRAQFWPFTLLVVALSTAAFFLAMIPIIFGQIMDGLSRAEELSRANPDDWVVTRGPGSVQYSYVGNDPAVAAQMMPDVSTIFVASFVMSLVVIALLAAAVVRRLHDRGYSGWLGMVPAAMLMTGFAVMLQLTASFGRLSGAGAQPMIGGLLAAFAINLAYLVSLLVLIIQCAMAGTPGPNRYGDAPTA